MVIPEINDAHLEVIEAQRKRLGTKRGFIAVKPNCSIQAYVPELTPLLKYGIKEVVATTYQAISGAGKTFNEWPEMIDNLIPFIGGEEEKSEKEPLRVWGKVEDGQIVPATSPVITTQCLRVPVSDGHCFRFLLQPYLYSNPRQRYYYWCLGVRLLQEPYFCSNPRQRYFYW